MSNPDPRFRIHRKASSGSEVFVIGLAMNSVGGKHHFADHRHARNFCKYLFSRSRSHQVNHLTARNVVCQVSQDGVWSGEGLSSPQVQFDAFMARQFPRANAEDLFCDDGAYAAFVVRRSDGKLISNVLRKEAGKLRVNERLIRLHRGDQSDIRVVTDMVGRGRSVTCFDQLEKPNDLTLQADILIQGLVRRELGGDPILTVSHRDQLDHNQTYHIHRLLRQSG